MKTSLFYTACISSILRAYACGYSVTFVECVSQKWILGCKTIIKAWWSIAYAVFHLSSVFCLPSLGVSIHFDTEEVTVLLPVHSTVSYVEEITYTHLSTAWHRDDSDSSWDVVLFRYPVGNIIIHRTPSKVSVSNKYSTLCINTRYDRKCFFYLSDETQEC